MLSGVLSACIKQKFRAFWAGPRHLQRQERSKEQRPESRNGAFIGEKGVLGLRGT
jgi:hypothetical protein